MRGRKQDREDECVWVKGERGWTKEELTKSRRERGMVGRDGAMYKVTHRGGAVCVCVNVVYIPPFPC